MPWLKRWRESTVYRPARGLVQALRDDGYRVLGVLTRCVLQLCGGRARREATIAPSTIQHVVLLRPDRLGDIVLVLPAFQAVRQCFPTATITAVVTPQTAPMVRDHPTVNHCVTVAGDGAWEIWRSRAALRDLQPQPVDVAIAFEPSWACGLLAYLTGARQRVGWAFRGAGAFFTHRVPYRSAAVKTHEIDANLQLVAALGVSAPRQLPHVVVPPAARAWVAQWWQTQGWPTSGIWVLIHPGSRMAYTRWPAERFAAIADRLLELPETHVILLAGSGEAALVARVQAMMRHAPHIVRDVDVAQLAALLERMHFFIGNSTGTTHLAAYLGPRPQVIEIIGGTHPLACPERWGVLGAQHRIVHRRPEDVIGRSTDAWIGPEGLAHIRVEDVWRVVRAVWPTHPQQLAGRQEPHT